MGKYFNMNELEVDTELKIRKTGNVGTLAEECDFSVKVQNKEVPRIQEMHAFILHEICEVLE